MADRAFTGAFALIASTTACAIVVLAAPRPVEPRQLPALRLEPAALAQQAADDAELAGRAPRGADVDALLAALREAGLREREGEGGEALQEDARALLAERARVVFARLDRSGARALLLAVTTRGFEALHGALASREEARGLLGRFPELLARYGYVDAQGRWLAPELAGRALYAARFNLWCGRALLQDVTPLERRAHDGWMALHVGVLDPELRAEAARSFHALGGRYGAEAEAIWRYQGGDLAGAHALLREAYARTGWLRLRNLSLGAVDPSQSGT